MANLKTLVSASLTAGLLSAGIAHAADGNPFQSQQLESGFLLAANDKMPEGSCGGDKKMGEGKCGGEKKAEAKCGADKKMKDGKCGGDKAKAMQEKKKDGKCGEGKCGAGKMKKTAPES